jgi:hypothetical protein
MNLLKCLQSLYPLMNLLQLNQKNSFEDDTCENVTWHLIYLLKYLLILSKIHHCLHYEFKKTKISLVRQHHIDSSIKKTQKTWRHAWQILNWCANLLWYLFLLILSYWYGQRSCYGIIDGSSQNIFLILKSMFSRLVKVMKNTQ